MLLLTNSEIQDLKDTFPGLTMDKHLQTSQVTLLDMLPTPEYIFFFNLKTSVGTFTIGRLHSTYNNCYRITSFYDVYVNKDVTTAKIFNQHISSFGEMKRRIQGLITQIELKNKNEILTNKMEKLSSDFE